MDIYPDQTDRVYNNRQSEIMTGKAPEPGELSELIRRFRGRTNDLENRIALVDEIRGRLIPGAPQTQGLGENKHDSGLLPAFAAELNRYEYLIDYLTSVIEDLQKAV